MADAEEIHDLFRSREARLAGRFGRIREVSDVYNGMTELPLPELAGFDKAAVPNLTQLGVDQVARRVASVIPNLSWPSLRPGIGTEDDRADTRRQVNYGWWERNNWRRIRGGQARSYIGHACGPMVVRPSRDITDGGGPRWERHHALETFPSPTPLDNFAPSDVILRHRRTYHWLNELYPEPMARLRVKRDTKPDDEFTCLEHITADYVCFVVCSNAEDSSGHYQFATKGSDEEVLFEFDNLAGRCWVTYPTRPGLDAPIGQFDTIMGMYATQAALMAMHVHATIKAVYPEPWAVNPNGMAIPNIVQLPNRETGEPGIITNGILNDRNLDPSYRGLEVMDRLESNQRQTAALPPELGGTGGENVRTGRRGSQIASMSLDFAIAEAQDDLAMAMRIENEIAAAIDKGFYNTTKSFNVSWKSAKGRGKYVPSEIWVDEAQCVVEYPLAGTDLSDLVINGGQRVGQGSLSIESFMEIDPLVKDVDAELQRIRLQGIEQAFFTGLQTMASQPEGPWQIPDLVRLTKLMIAENKPWYEAVAQLQAEKQAEQAQGAPEGSPETMPGLAMPGQGAEVPAIPGLPAGSQDVAALLSQLGVADQAIRMR